MPPCNLIHGLMKTFSLQEVPKGRHLKCLIPQREAGRNELPRHHPPRHATDQRHSFQLLTDILQRIWILRQATAEKEFEVIWRRQG